MVFGGKLCFNKRIIKSNIFFQFVGWKNIFTTYGLAAWDHDEAIVNLSFQSTTEIVKDLFANNNQALIEAFQVMNFVRSILGFFWD